VFLINSQPNCFMATKIENMTPSRICKTVWLYRPRIQRIAFILKDKSFLWLCNFRHQVHGTAAEERQKRKFRPVISARYSTVNAQLFCYIQDGFKIWHFLYALTSYALTSSNIDRFSNLFYCLHQENICTILSLKIPSRFKCVATLPCEMSVS